MSARDDRDRLADAIFATRQPCLEWQRADAYAIADAVLAEIAKDGEQVRGLIAEADARLAFLQSDKRGHPMLPSNHPEVALIRRLKTELERVYGLTPEEGGR